jgi:saccharopine dehydrogenase (NAD+, L-lysine-forming)
MRACLREKVPYVDLGGLFHMTRRQMELDAEFREAGLTAVIGMGADPGITNVHAARAADELRTIERIHIYDGMLPASEDAIVWGYSIATILDEVTMNPFAFRDGKFIELAPLSEPEAFVFAEPVGLRTVHHSLHSEIATLPLVYADRGLREVTFKINHFGFTPQVLERLKVLADLGFASTDQVTVRGMTVVPRDVMVAVLSAQASEAAPETPEGAEELVTVAEGTDESGPVTVTLRTLTTKPRWGFDPGSVMTGTPPAIVAAMLASGELRKPGVHPPETAVAPGPFFQALAKRGIGTRIAVERGL